MVNLFGKGFVGSYYAQIYNPVVNERNDLIPKSNNILYFISTVDNYNIHINPYIDIDTNLTTLIRVLEHVKRLENPVFNFISSWYVYGDVKSNADETSPCNPQGFYSITKRTAEQLLISYCKTFDIKYRILRLSNVLGPGDKKVSSKKNVLTYMLRKIKNNEDIELYNHGNFYRDYMHVIDSCRAINTVINTAPLNEIYNIGSGVPILFSDAVDYIINKTRSSSKIKNIEVLDKDKQPISFYMNSNKLKNLGFSVNYSMTSILNELIDEIS